MNEYENLIEITAEQSVTVISFTQPTISGVTGLEDVSSQIRKFVAENKCGKIVIDFNGVKFFSSQVLGLLVDTWRKLQATGGVMVISGINPQLGRVFRITNLDRIFEFCPDKQTAIETIKAKTVNS